MLWGDYSKPTGSFRISFCKFWMLLASLSQTIVPTISAPSTSSAQATLARSIYFAHGASIRHAGKALISEFHRFFRPEPSARFDEEIVFKPLSPARPTRNRETGDFPGTRAIQALSLLRRWLR
jgi:hypothetical protein